MTKRITITDLQRRTAKVISDIAQGPVVVSRRGRPAAVIVTVEDYAEMEQAVAEVEALQVHEIVDAGLASYEAGLTFPHASVARRVRLARQNIRTRNL